MRYFLVILLLGCTCTIKIKAQISADFNLPSEVCLDEQFLLENTSSNATNYEWDFCVGDLIKTNLEILSNNDGDLSVPVGASFIKIEGNWYAFTANINNNTITKLSFGDNINNTPTITNLENYGGYLSQPENLKVVNDNDSIYIFVSNRINNKLIRINLGTDINNTNPTTDIILSGDQDIFNNGIEIKHDGQNWVGFYTASDFIYLINFGSHLSNIPLSSDITQTPTISNINNIGDIEIVRENGNWFGIIVGYSSRTLVRLDFGSSLLTTPTTTSITPSGLSTVQPQGIKIIQEAGNIYAFIVSFNGNLVRLDFETSILNIPNFNDLGTFGGELNRTLKIDLAYEDSQFLGFTTNYNNNTLLFIEFPNFCPIQEPTSISENPVIEFNEAGQFKIALKAINSDNETAFLTKQVEVSDNQAPIGQLTFDSEYCITNNIPFEFNTQDDINTYNWDFGDDNFNTTNPSTHQYENDGEYITKLEVESANGCNNIFYDTISIFPEPVPTFNAAPATVCTNNPIELTNSTDTSAYPSGLVEWNWNLDNESQTSSSSTQYTFDTDGEKAITLSASIPGCSADSTRLFDVLEGPQVDFSLADTCLGDSVYFTNLTTGDNITGYQWSFGNNQSSSQQAPSPMLYDTTGTYDVTLDVENEAGCLNSLTKPTTIHPLPETDMDADLSCTKSATQLFDRTTISEGEVTGWEWVTPQDDTLTDQNPTYVFEEAGIHAIQLTAISDVGCRTTVNNAIETITSPTVDFNTTASCLNDFSTFEEQASDPNYTIDEYRWTILKQPGTVTLFGPDVNHRFTEAKEYPVALEVTSESGCRATHNDTIAIFPLPQADFDYRDNCENQPALFTDNSEINGDSIISYQWLFSEEGFASGDSATVSFRESGNKTVRLDITTARNCQVQVDKTVPIHPQPTAAFSATPAFGAPPLDVSTTNNSQQAVDYIWHSGDGESSTESSPTFTYGQLGSYPLQLRVVSEQGCTDSTTHMIEVREPRFDLRLSDFESYIDNGQVYLRTNIHNASNVRLEQIYLDISLSGQNDIRINVPVLPAGADTSGFTFPLSMDEAQFNSSPYICATAGAATTAFSDETPDNNSTCIGHTEELYVKGVYPNPVANESTLRLFTPHTGNLHLRLFDVKGREIYHETHTIEDAGEFRFPVNMRGLINGLYLLKIDISGHIVVERLVKE